MESLPKNILLEFNPDTLEAVRKEFNLDKPGRMDEAIDILDDWVQKQNHFKKKDFSRDYLERTLITSKGLIERAKTRLDKLCTFKTLLPHFFENTDAKEEFAELHKSIAHALLPKMTPDNCRVYLFKLYNKDDIDGRSIFNYYKYIALASEYMKVHEYCTGYILILDYSDANIMALLTKLNIVELRQALTVLMEGYGMRLKGVHIITPSKAITALTSVIKQVLSEKLSKRVHAHKSFETVYDHIPKEILPVEYGGKERSLKQLNEESLQVFSSKEYIEYIHEMNEAKTEESCRRADQFAEQYIGMPGSFRSLSVD